jgi:hypothetical protein
MDPEVIVTGGVDTHTDVHVAAVLDQTGRLLATQAFPATTRGYARLATWLESFGPSTRSAWKAPATSVPACCASCATTA